MKPLLYAILTIGVIVGLARFTHEFLPDNSAESGLRRDAPEERQAEEDNSIWETQRYNKNDIERNQE